MGLGYNFRQKLCPTGLRNNPNRLLSSVNYITIHCTGNYNSTATAKSHADYLYVGSGGRQASWHYTADDKEVWQSFDDNRRCWHATDGTNGAGNATSIGIEICVNNRAGFPTACDNAAHLTAGLLKKHKLTPDKAVQHNHWKSSAYPNGKDCPAELRSGAWGVTWSQFVNTVKKYYEGDDEVLGEMKLVINGGKEITIPSVLKDDRNYPQLQALAVAVGFKVDYDAAKNQVLITK